MVPSWLHLWMGWGQRRGFPDIDDIGSRWRAWLRVMGSRVQVGGSLRRRVGYVRAGGFGAGMGILGGGAIPRQSELASCREVSPGAR